MLSTLVRNYGDVFSCRRTPGSACKFCQEDAEVPTREGPLKGLGCLGVMLLEAHQALFDKHEGTKVVGREDLALDHREVDLDLVKPTGVHRSVDQHDLRPPG